MTKFQYCTVLGICALLIGLAFAELGDQYVASGALGFAVGVFVTGLIFL